MAGSGSVPLTKWLGRSKNLRIELRNTKSLVPDMDAVNLDQQQKNGWIRSRFQIQPDPELQYNTGRMVYFDKQFLRKRNKNYRFFLTLC
jgi:hypothetical protein